MILGLSLTQFTFLHVFLSLVAIATGIFLVYGFLTSLRLRILTSLFFVTTALTSITGFLYPFKGVTPGIILGVLSLIVLLLAYVALYVKKLAGGWRATYVVSVMLAFWFNFFVLVAQAVQKVPAIHSFIPSQAAPGFMIAQGAVFLVFLLLTVRAVKKFHPGA
jgi:hypothetical protein